MAGGEERRQGKEETAEVAKDEFPVGMRVLAVDDDRVCLKVLEAQLRFCKFQPTMVQDGATALRMLREGREQFDLVISDVHMPDMDGYRLLQLIGLEMDIPVIMLSANEENEAVYKAIESGACDYLVKPVKIKELKQIWQHVVRRTLDPRVLPADIAEGERGGTKSIGKKKYSRRERNSDQDDPDENKENKYLSTKKKPRLTWTRELHGRFLRVINQIGIDRAAPKKIWEMMNVSHVTRDSVSSHLQRYRLYLKKFSGYTTRRSDPFADSCERWNSYHGMDDLGSFKHHHEYESSSSSSNLFARMDAPSAFGNHGVKLTTESFPLRNPQSRLDVGPVAHGGNMLMDARNFPPTSPHAKSNANILDDTMLDDDDDDEIHSCYHGNSTNILRNMILEASKVTLCNIESSLENMPSDAAMSMPVNKFPVKSAARSLPVNEFPMQPLQLGNQPSVQRNCTLHGDDSQLQDIVGNCSRSWQTVVSTKFPDLGHGDGACASLGASQENVPNINQLTTFVASSSQIPVLHDQMTAPISSTAPVAGFNEEMLPFDISGNKFSMETLGENFAFGSASIISSPLPVPEMDNFVVPTQMPNVGGAVGTHPVLQEDMVGSQALGDQLSNSNQALDDQLNHNNQVRECQLDYINQALDDHLNYSNDFLVGTDEPNMNASSDEFFSEFPSEDFIQDNAFMGWDWI